MCFFSIYKQKNVYIDIRSTRLPICRILPLSVKMERYRVLTEDRVKKKYIIHFLPI